MPFVGAVTACWVRRRSSRCLAGGVRGLGCRCSGCWCRPSPGFSAWVQVMLRVSVQVFARAAGVAGLQVMACVGFSCTLFGTVDLPCYLGPMLV